MDRVILSSGERIRLGQRDGIGFSGFLNRPGTDLLWAVAGSPLTNDTLYSINVRTGVISPIGTTGFNVRMNALYWGADGALTALAADALLRIDTTTGAGTFETYLDVEGLRSIAVLPRSTATGSEIPKRSPESFAIDQNYPNPFNPSTTIKYELPRAAHVTICVFDALGREVSVLVNERIEAGSHEVQFDADGLASGIYLYRLRAGEFASTKKMLVLK